MFERSNEEYFTNKPKRSIDLGISNDMKINSISKKLDMLSNKMNFILEAMNEVSERVNTAMDQMLAYDRTLTDLETKMIKLKNQMNEIEAITPDVEISEYGNEVY